MSGGRSRRTLGTLFVIAAAGIALLLAGKDKLQEFVENLPKPPPPEAAVAAQPDLSGAARFADGQPAAGARVTVDYDDGTRRSGESVVGPDGAFSWRFPEPEAGSGAGGKPRIESVVVQVGPLSAKASAEDLRPTAPGGSKIDLTFPATFRMAGLVQHTETRAAVAGARVECAGKVAMADDEGAFAFPAIPAEAVRQGDLRVTVRAGGFAVLVWPVPMDALPPTYGDLALRMIPDR